MDNSALAALLLFGAAGVGAWASTQRPRHRDRLKGGVADKMKPGDFDERQLKMGTAHELEHTGNRRLAREIAMDHLAEDPLYYSHLEQMEKRVAKKKRGRG